MKVRALKQGALNGRIIQPGEEFDLTVAPGQWFGPTGWLEMVDRLYPVPRPGSMNPLRVAHPPMTLSGYQDAIDRRTPPDDDPPPKAA